MNTHILGQLASQPTHLDVSLTSLPTLPDHLNKH